MSTTFMTSPSLLLTSESVAEGHPDKMCDQLSDAILDAILAQDPYGRVACETAATTGLIVVMGEISTDCYIDIAGVVRETVRDIGYTRAKYGFDCDTCGVIISLKEQSKDIAMGVDESFEFRATGLSHDEMERLGAGDQGMMVGFACTETPELMPLPISLAHKICHRLAQVRREDVLPYLRPDGKSQVTVEYAYGQPKRVDAIVVAAQHDEIVSNEVLRRDIMEMVVKQAIPPSLLDDRTRFYINATGRFVVGGPMGDAGLTGRKIIVDTYGGVARHGGGAFSGKDPTKVDRSGAYAARYVAKKRRGVGASRPHRGTTLLRYRRIPSYLHLFGDLWHGKGRGGDYKAADRQALRPAPRRHHSVHEPAKAHLSSDCVLRPLWPRGPGCALGANGQSGHAPNRSGPARGRPRQRKLRGLLVAIRKGGRL